MEAPISNGSREMASVFVMRELRSQIASLYIRCMNGETRIVPKNPISLFTQAELDCIQNSRQRVFYSYFSLPDVELRVKINFEPDSEFDYLIIGMYHRKNGIDDQLTNLLERRPELFVFVLPSYFIALFTPHLPHDDFETIDIAPDHKDYPLCILLDGEAYDCLELADRLHGSPFLLDVTFHMSTNHHIFKAEIARRRMVESDEETT